MNSQKRYDEVIIYLIRNNIAHRKTSTSRVVIFAKV